MRIIDAGHIVSDVNTKKEYHNKHNADKNSTHFTPRDPDASWGCKKSITVDKDKKIPLYFHGYKEHTCYDPFKNLITEVQVTSGEVYDGHLLQPLLKAEKKKKHMQTTRKYAPHPIRLAGADKGYDDGENHEYLITENIHDAIILKETRTTKKDSNKQRWIELENNAFYKF